MSSLSHLRRHSAFYLALLAGIAVAAAAQAAHWAIPAVLGGDAFFVIYLASVAAFRVAMGPEELRRRAREEDEGILIILVLAVAAIAFSLSAIFVLLNRQAAPDPWQLACAIASVPLGWVTLHTIAAFHYAHLYYAAADEEPSADVSPGDAGGLQFPGNAAPGAWDFLYFSFVIGMTAQVSDVAVLTSHLRRLALGHGVLSFFYNTVLIALAVNVAIAIAR